MCRGRLAKGHISESVIASVVEGCLYLFRLLFSALIQMALMPFLKE